MNVKMKHSLMDRIRGAIRVFKRPSAELGAVIYGVKITNCEECGKTSNAVNVVYLCDGQDPRCACGLKSKECQHTSDISHAKNFANVMNPSQKALWVEMDEEDKEAE